MKLANILSLLFSGTVFLSAQPSTERIGIENDYAKINAEAEKASKIPLRPAAELSLRGGMPNLFAKLESGEPVTIAYYGGSITAGPGWRTATLDWFAKQYPKAKITELNASVGGSGSLVGVFRADHDLVGESRMPCSSSFPSTTWAMCGIVRRKSPGRVEGIVRKLRMSKPDTDICLAYTLHSSACGSAQRREIQRVGFAA